MKIKKEIKITGERLLIFGGVYSNLQSLEKMKQIAGKEQISPENIVCTGDIVGYCAQPEECVNSIRDWGIHSIAGNVEIQLREGSDDCGCDFVDGGRCDVFSRNWYAFAQSKVSTPSLNWFESLPDHLSFRVNGKNFLVVHGSPAETSDFVFKSTPWKDKSIHFNSESVDVIVGGHCGLPFIDQYEGKSWINSGVIGMPANDGTSRVWYGILNALSGQFHLKSFVFDHKTTSQLMIKNGLPESYAKTLGTGIWDNCEILPLEETEKQGLPLSEIVCEI